MTIGGLVARLGALVLAILMVVGALAWRAGREGPGDVGGPAATADPTSDPGPLTEIVCAQELRICDELTLDGDLAGVQVRSVDGVTTAQELATATAAPVWLTLRSLTGMVAEARDRAGEAPLLDATATVVSSPLVMVVWQDRAAALTQTCDTVGWSCVGRVAEQPWSASGGEQAWGVVKPAHPAPDRSGIGLLVLAQASAEQLGRADFSSRDLDSLDYERWFTSLEQAVPTFRPTGGSHVQHMIQFGPASIDVAGATEAEAVELLDRAGSRASNLVIIDPPPAVVAEVVIAGPRGEAVPERLVEQVRAALIAVGWREDPAVAPALRPDAPAVTDPATFSGGILEAIRLRWERVR